MFSFCFVWIEKWDARKEWWTTRISAFSPREWQGVDGGQFDSGDSEGIDWCMEEKVLCSRKCGYLSQRILKFGLVSLCKTNLKVAKLIG